MNYIDKEIDNLNIFDGSSINLYGRSKILDYKDKKQIFFGYTGTGFELIVEPIDINNELKATLLTESDLYEHQYIKIYIDNKVDKVIELTNGEEEITLFKNLKTGKHTIKVIKMNELNTTKLYMSNLVGNNYKYYKRIYNPKRNTIEFYGDSLTAGYGNLGNPSVKAYLTSEQDGTMAYAYLVANKLDYDPSIICFSGVSLTKSLSIFGLNIMDKYDTYDGIHPYNGENNIPSIVVINLGTNDNSGYLDINTKEIDKINGVKEFIDNYEILLNYIKNKAPNCKIVSCYNMSFSFTKELLDALNICVNNVNKKYGDNTCYMIGFKGDTNGSDGHPSYKAHKEYADILYKFIIDKVI
ncbi:MAG: GDSL-type esterase/lipase family protein [Mollicutes bacterium]|nr:GDSL-type esterase/lipase family protein [Mollicutes bacterium]MDD7263651.1 GDSL-type esterase/lipase family protein [bacterium]MDY4979250.1 GDSL-type esterase/lipase family protein [Candidatus Onthovivens sp.]